MLSALRPLLLRSPLLALAATLAAPASGSSNLLVNGSFETWSGGLYPSNQPDRRFNDGTLAVPGWNFAIGLSSDVYRDLNATGAASSYYDAAAGDWLAGAGSFATTHEGVSQTFNVLPNTWHRVTFRMAPGGINYSGSWIENATIGSSWLVDITGAVFLPVSQSFNTNLAHFSVSSTTNPLVWTPQTLFFKSNAVGGAVTLQFTAYGDMTHVFLDDVVVNEYATPFNDDCSTATTISGSGPHPFDNSVCSTGTQGQSESLCLFAGQTAIQSDQWYVWTAGANGFATLTTCGGIASGSSDDTKVAVYSGNACPTAPAIACNDDLQCGTSALTSTVTWNINCGQKYLIQLGRSPGAGASFGTFSLTEFGLNCTGTVHCAGDGSGTACPCGNLGTSGHGCGNSVDPAGAVLAALGSARVSSDSLVLMASGMPNSSALYFQGTSATGGGNGVAFGDGLRCAGGSVLRLGVTTNAGGGSQYPGLADLPISIRGAIPQGGGVREYQVWYRNAAAFCTASTFNLSNGLEVVWLP
ncbi:MAG: hypothetical protein NTY35_14690 [Planctomycetota bacterium]|nr:hypothetical protein [Planctomycetota bacterium]